MNLRWQNLAATKKRAVNEAEGWRKIRSDLVVARMEGFCPASNQCSSCGSSEVPEIIWCPDCGPNTLYCMMCNENIHRMVMYHQAYVWKNVSTKCITFVKVYLFKILAYWNALHCQHCVCLKFNSNINKHYTDNCYIENIKLACIAVYLFFPAVTEHNLFFVYLIICLC